MRLISLAIVVTLNPVAHAQTGAMVPEPSVNLETFRTEYFKTKPARDAFIQFREQRQLKLNKNRRDCRSAIRRANRDTKLPTILRCYRTELLVKIELLEHQMETIDILPGITEPVRQVAIEATDALSQALIAMVSGIDTGVYAHTDDLKGAKQVLTERYITPYWRALIAVRAGQLHTWALYMLQKIAVVPLGEVPAGAKETLIQSYHCFEEATALLEGIQTTETVIDAKEALAESHRKLQQCVDLTKTAKSSSEQEEE